MNTGTRYGIACLLMAFFLSACKPGPAHSYAIRDFSDSLQPYLARIVSNGKVGYDSAEAFVAKHTTNDELQQLAASEHPLLRAVALQEMLNRKDIDYIKALTEHLGDTAMVLEEGGEFPDDFIAVSDLMILHSTFKSREDKNNIIEKVLTGHNYLRAAYLIADRIPPQEKYYPYIRQMAEREGSFLRQEHALYALAQFKKPADTGLIKEKLLQHTWRMSSPSFMLMKEYPNDAYLDVLEKYYHSMYRNIWWVEGGVENVNAFFEALGVYKQPRSAVMLDHILNRKPFLSVPADTVRLKYTLAHAIWDNPCPAYMHLQKQLKPIIIEEKKNTLEIPMPAADTLNVHEVIGWL